MCQFFCCISDGKGKVDYFKPEEIFKIMVSGNPKNYDFNSHTSLCHFRGILGAKEDKVNKWEYCPKKKELKRDTINAEDDSKKILPKLKKFFKDKDVLFLRNIFGKNSGNGNSGNRNSGNWNSGNWNSGDWNSGYWNSGNRNSGNGNSGNRNSGNGNSGNRNSGNRNSGNGNSGDWNSGNWNSGNGVLNGFCSEQKFLLFNKSCTKKEYEKIYELSWSWFNLTLWISGGDMTGEEKKNHPYWETTGGYLKMISYKDAWKKCPKEFIDKVKKLNNFDPKVFEEITSLKV